VLILGPGPQLVLQDVFTGAGILLHDHELAVVDVAKVLEVLDRKMVPLHQKDPRHEAVRDEDADTGEVRFIEAAPERVVEA
jgi:hypothetical protein